MCDNNRNDKGPFMPSPESPEESQKLVRRFKWILPAIIGLLIVLFTGFLLFRQQLFPPKPVEETPPSTTSTQAPEKSATPSPTEENPRFNITAVADSMSGFKLMQQDADMLLTPDRPLESGQVYRLEMCIAYPKNP